MCELILVLTNETSLTSLETKAGGQHAVDAVTQGILHNLINAVPCSVWKDPCTEMKGDLISPACI